MPVKVLAGTLLFPAKQMEARLSVGWWPAAALAGEMASSGFAAGAFLEADLRANNGRANRAGCNPTSLIKVDTAFLLATTMNFFKSQPISLPKHNCVLAHALKVPSLQKLVGKRVILASNSPRRREILRTFVSVFTHNPRTSCLYYSFIHSLHQGLEPEIVPSTFEEDLPHGEFEDVHEYPVATATHKAVEVYERLLVSVAMHGTRTSPDI